MTTLSGRRFRLLSVGGLRVLGALIKVGRAVMPAPDDPFPPWQGMQYLHNMFEGRGVLAPLDNDRYPDIRWTPVRDVLAARGRRALRALPSAATAPQHSPAPCDPNTSR